jgi:hypothetical protein
MIPICQHCGHSKVNRPRGLCWSCYYKPGVKDMYPSTSKYARRGVGNFTGNAPISGEPTIHPPGTPEKMAVLELRAKNKQALWHPLDAQYPNDPRPLLALRGITTEDASEARPVLRNRLEMATSV